LVVVVGCSICLFVLRVTGGNSKKVKGCVSAECVDCVVDLIDSVVLILILNLILTADCTAM
jgi:hypothetical protein